MHYLVACQSHIDSESIVDALDTNPGYSVAEADHILIDELALGAVGFAKPICLDQESEGPAAIFSELLDIHALVLLGANTVPVP